MAEAGAVKPSKKPPHGEGGVAAGFPLMLRRLMGEKREVLQLSVRCYTL